MHVNIVVTGAQGFVGLNVVHHLASIGHQVYAIGRRELDGWGERFLSDVADQVQHRKVDLVRRGELAEALENDEFEALIHAAVVTSTTRHVEIEASRQIIDVNIGGTMEALDLARVRRLSRFVYISSSSAIGNLPADVQVNEGVALNPDSLYGITKMTSEAIVRRYGDLHNLSTVSVRIAQPYGPGERATPSRVRTSPIYEWLRDVEKDEPLPTGPMDRQRDWTYVAETARGIGMLSVADSVPHQIYNLGLGRQIAVGEVIAELRKRHPQLMVDEQPDDEILNPNISGEGREPLSVSRFTEDFGWSPQIGITEGIQRYLAWWEAFHS